MRSKKELNEKSVQVKRNSYAWIEQGNVLLQCAEWTIKTPLSKYMYEDPPRVDRFTGLEAASLQRRFARTYVYRLMIGSALECFLKAHPNNSGNETHEAVSLAKAAELEFSERQGDLIQELGLFAVIGRYPFVSDKMYRQLNSGKDTFLEMWSEIDQVATEEKGVFATGDKIHFGFIDLENAQIEIDFVRKLREQIKQRIDYQGTPHANQPRS